MRVVLFLAFVASVAAASFSAPSEEALAGHNCVWASEGAFINDPGSVHFNCRTTFVIDPGQGQVMSRGLLLANAGYLINEGFNMNFLWYSYDRVSSYLGSTLWSDCGPPRTRGTNGACSHPIGNRFFPMGQAFPSPVPLQVFEFGNTFIVKGCGNYGIDRSARPIPRISGYKFNDLNANGNWDGGEPPLTNWVIRLHNSSGNVRTTTTNGGGYYEFALDGLGPDTYSITEDLQPGWVVSRTPSAIGVGYGIGDYRFEQNNFGNYQPGVIKGRKFEDMNGNGVDNGDPAVTSPSVTIHLDGTAGNGAPVSLSTPTDGAGNYAFTNVVPGSYTVSETVPAGWNQSNPQPVPPGTHGVPLQSGQTVPGRDFGNWQPASVSGRKFEDLDANGPDPSDPGVGGWPIQLTGTDGLGQPVVRPIQNTLPDGTYSFTNLPPGQYALTEGTQPGWQQSYPLPVPPGQHSLTLQSGENETGRDFGNYRYAQISGRKYEDMNADGDDETGADPGVQTWTIQLQGIDGFGAPVNRTELTDLSGDYLFDSVVPGTYTLTEVLQPGWTAREGNAGYPVAPISGDNIMNRRFGNWRFSTPSGVKYDDLNGNGIRDGGEPGLGGWTITLAGTDGYGAAVNRTEVTLPSGGYTFTNVVPGNYTISELLQGGPDWVQTQPVGSTYPIILSSNQTQNDLAFGNLVRAEVHGAKFEDMNEDGDRDPEDVGLGGWQIRLQGADGMGNAVNRTTTTAGDGTYSFLQIMPGTYTVCETNPDLAIWYQTKPPANGCYPFTLQSHDVQNTVEFGNYERSTIQGVKFSDENKDGDQDAGDPLLAGWVVTLRDCAGNLIPQSMSTVTQPVETSDLNPQLTNGAGQYQFRGLHNQCYRIDETTQPPEWVQTQPCLDPVGACGYQIDDVLSGATFVRDFGNFEQPPIEKVPEGNEYNVDLDVPKANLWICETGPCSGPGEGNLIVFERVRNVHTGDQNGDFIEDGLGAYEFTVEYDNFVIQSVNPCDIVFGAGGAGSTRGLVDELDSSDNPYCSPDPNGANNGTCAISLILENLIHFGCVTYGQVPGPTGDFDIAALNLIPHPDLKNDIFPGNNNGVLTVIKDNGCELVDTFGHPIIGSINGGLTPLCRDLAITVRILEGDLDLDCDVDLTDAQLISYRYGGFFGGLLYSKWYDLEPELHDLDIDIKDVQKVFGRDGSTCQLPIPGQPPLDPPTPFQD